MSRADSERISQIKQRHFNVGPHMNGCPLSPALYVLQT